MSEPVCIFCEGPINPSRCYQKVEGFEFVGKRYGSKSGSSIVLRQKVQTFACETCVQLHRRGIPPEQMKLA